MLSDHVGVMSASGDESVALCAVMVSASPPTVPRRLCGILAFASAARTRSAFSGAMPRWRCAFASGGKWTPLARGAVFVEVKNYTHPLLTRLLRQAAGSARENQRG